MSETHRIRPGIHRARAVAGSEQYGPTSNGHPQIVLDLVLLETRHRVSTFLVFSEASAPYSMQRLRALGWTGSDLSDLRGVDAAEVDVEVRYEDYQGEAKMKVDIVAGGTVILEKTYDAAQKKRFGERFASLAKSVAPVAPPSNGSAAQDEIPF